MAQLPDGLLADVTADLGITWTLSETESRRLENHIALGISYLDGKLGVAGDYAVSGDPRSLLFEYVRYRRDNALDVFEQNYGPMIVAMQHKRMVTAYAQDTVSAEQ